MRPPSAAVPRAREVPGAVGVGPGAAVPVGVDALGVLERIVRAARRCAGTGRASFENGTSGAVSRSSSSASGTSVAACAISAACAGESLPFGERLRGPPEMLEPLRGLHASRWPARRSCPVAGDRMRRRCGARRAPRRWSRRTAAPCGPRPTLAAFLMRREEPAWSAVLAGRRARPGRARPSPRPASPPPSRASAHAPTKPRGCDSPIPVRETAGQRPFSRPTPGADVTQRHPKRTSGIPVRRRSPP